MGSNNTHTEINVDNDPRLAAALSAVLEQSAGRLGLSEDALRVLNGAVQAAWRDVWRSLNGTNEKLHVECEEFPDRLELTFRCAGRSGSDLESCATALKGKVDQVNLETHAGKSKLTLIKFGAKR